MSKWARLLTLYDENEELSVRVQNLRAKCDRLESDLNQALAALRIIASGPVSSDLPMMAAATLRSIAVTSGNGKRRED